MVFDKRKVVLVRLAEKAGWKSCQVIGNNLEKAYRIAFLDDVEVVTVSESARTDEFSDLSKKIKKINPKLVIFLDYKPNPAQALTELYTIFNSHSDEVPPIWIHLYGDFLLEISSWISTEAILRNQKITFLVASNAQKKLVEKFIEHPNVSCLPFPVDTDFYCPSEDREHLIDWREKLSIGKESFIYLYTGRVSYQKNIEELINTFKAMLKVCDIDAYLIIAGPIDNIGQPYIGIVPDLDLHYNVKIANLAKDEKRVIILPNLDEVMLKSLYLSSDSYISLGTHNDEDFGMSPAEAISCGLPLILTSWGGFTSFGQMFPDSVKLIPIVRMRNKFLPKTSDAIKNMLTVAKIKQLSKSENHEKAEAMLSATAIAQRIVELSKQRANLFNGFLDDARWTAQLFAARPRDPFAESEVKFNQPYYHLYKKAYFDED